MRKALNFDLDTKKYEDCTGRKAPITDATSNLDNIEI